MENILQSNFEWYLANRKDLVKKYNGKYLIIKDNAVVGSYDADYDALTQAEKQYEEGSFIIQKCSSAEADFSQTFLSRVAFV